MSQFKYTLPSGKRFVVNGPAGATQADADRIFYEQVAAGALVGFVPGDTLSSLESQLAQFGLSRLDRGTAGVSDTVVLAVVSGLPIVTPLPPLINVAIENPITQEDVATVTNGLGPLPVGPLSPVEVQTLEAQKINILGQPYFIITREKGIGKYGFNCIQLEKTGYVKPSTSQIYLGVISETQPNPENFIAVMSSPSIWTGKNGVTSLEAILTNEELQNQIYNELMLLGYKALVASGTIVERNTTAVDVMTATEYKDNTPYTKTLDAVDNKLIGEQGALVNLSATYGPEATTAWANNQSVNEPSSFDTLAKSSQGAIALALGLLGTLFAGIKAALGYANTTNRETVDSATKRVIGNPKIDSPQFTITSESDDLDITQAASILSDKIVNQGQNIYTQLVNQTNSTVTAAGDQISQTTNRFRA